VIHLSDLCINDNGKQNEKSKRNNNNNRIMVATTTGTTTIIIIRTKITKIKIAATIRPINGRRKMLE
jgi:hypothetical protein